MQNNEIILLGGPNSGKTHYAGQLYGRLQRNPGIFSLRRDEGAPANLSLLQDVLRNLEDGNASSHTPTKTWGDIDLPLIDSEGNTYDLRWPDYGGEQLKHVFDSRSVNQDWQRKLCAASSWIVLIRLNAEVTYLDALAKLAGKQEECQSDEKRISNWDANAYWVEKLQILLHVAKHGIITPLKRPKLTVLLSCYDELDHANKKPEEMLSNKLPLVASFIRNNWEEDAVSIWGLSALGQSLTGESNADNFIDDGPEFQGWVVPPEGGETNQDICLPIMWSLNGVK
jgi:hypothetical protein